VTDITPGVYRLTQAVENPKGNHRVKHQLRRLPRWAEGTVFVVRDCWYEDKRMGLGLQAPGFPGETLSEKGDHYPLIVPHLEPVPKTLQTVLLAANARSGYVLRQLLDRGVLTLDQIEEVVGPVAREVI